MLHKGISKIIFSMIVFISTGLIFCSSVAKADSESRSFSDQSESSEKISTNYAIPERFKKLNRFVEVKDNKFVLNVPQDQNFDRKLIAEANDQLKIAN